MPQQSTRITIACARCGKPFERPACHDGRAKYCSLDCRSASMTRACLQCGAPFRVQFSVLAKGKGNYCSQPCANAARRDELPRRFWSRVDRSGGPDACWPWQGSFGTAGYGQFRLPDANISAHRMAYTLTYGPIPADRPHVLHTCDNRPCCNPAHLFAGTALDNMRDKVAKGRQARDQQQGTHTQPETVRHGDEHYTRQHPELVRRGEAATKAKLTEGQVVAIRERHAAGVKTGILAREYGIAPTNIRKIVRRENWAHVP
jgi:hypothetical protein